MSLIKLESAQVSRNPITAQFSSQQSAVVSPRQHIDRNQFANQYIIYTRSTNLFGIVQGNAIHIDEVNGGNFLQGQGNLNTSMGELILLFKYSKATSRAQFDFAYTSFSEPLVNILYLKPNIRESHPDPSQAIPITITISLKMKRR